MERLILMRHGDAESPAPGLDDAERALTAEGRAESRAVGRALADAGFEPDLALVSAARRAAQTWDAAAEAFPGARARLDGSLYAATSTRLAAAVREAAADGRTLMLVGHNPGIHQLAVHLARQAGASARQVRPLYDRFPTGSAAVFAVGGAGEPSFERLFLARDYRDAVQ
jgi:phosphohistidine phosphatase